MKGHFAIPVLFVNSVEETGEVLAAFGATTRASMHIILQNLWNRKPEVEGLKLGKDIFLESCMYELPSLFWCKTHPCAC